MARRLTKKVYRLKRDIVIPAGAVFRQAPSNIALDDDHIEHVVGLTRDTVGSFIYEIGTDPELDMWFEAVEG